MTTTATGVFTAPRQTWRLKIGAATVGLLALQFGLAWHYTAPARQDAALCRAAGGIPTMPDGVSVTCTHKTKNTAEGDKQ